ncbi:PREDICTED: uncharacterized protein LOC104743720 [Camelina sativa]|uniref:Uncharacterized protein LOC104743720 n=1 Tax=Camelina sativa TaxID=90675 RepID=A0ABM0VYH0_CAMSA|nr:PREDICTED: uncharacterized protein LOC104743720 [Camelina sativa]
MHSSFCPLLMMMKIFCYNIRGLNTSLRQVELKRWVQASRPLLGGFLETHVQIENATAILARNFPGWRYDFNYTSNAQNGRIWIVWDPAVNVITFCKTDQLITCGVFDTAANLSFSLTFVYARNCMIAKRELWQTLQELHDYGLQRNHPWLILGDFNQILRADEHYSLLPYPHPTQGMAEFQQCIDSCEFLELASRGADHTWFNSQIHNPSTRKLDRALVNKAWLTTFPQANALFDAPGGSDHCPILVATSENEERRKVPFKFYSFFTSHPDYPGQVEAAWNSTIVQGNMMFSLCQKLKAVKMVCKSLIRTHFSNIQARSAEALEALSNT